MKRHLALSTACVVLLALVSTEPLRAQDPPLLPEPVVASIAREISGETAKQNLEFITRHHRMRGSRGFRAAARHVADRARAYGLQEVRIEQIPADGRTFYGTQKARPAWNAEFAELWELRREAGQWVRALRVASWDSMPVSLAQDSESGEVTAPLVDVGEGLAESDYAGRDVRGKLVLTASQPGVVAPLAVSRHGAAGIVSYAQNQRSAWWGEDESLVRWGHLNSFSPERTFAFMVSPRTARDWRQRLARGEEVRLHAAVRAGREPGFYDVVTASIPGSDPRLRDEEIVFSCHLDHQQPGANDNASGCAAILEVARTLAGLVADGRVPRPARTIRFVWPPEIEGTMALLNARPELAPRIRAAVHLDMVGGGPETKSIFHVTRGPASLPSFVNDVAEEFALFVNRQSADFTRSGQADYPLVAPEGGKEPLLAQLVEFTTGSDHQIYAEGSFRIPAIYLNDSPDRYIHTNRDSPANIDPTKLKRAAFIAAASGWFLAGLTADKVPDLWEVIAAGGLRRTAEMLRRRPGLPAAEADNLTRFHLAYERAVLDSVERFAPVAPEIRARARTHFAALESVVGSPPAPGPATGDAGKVYRRNPEVKGPMSVFGYDYFEDHYGEERARSIRLLRHRGPRGSGGEYAYEVLNFVDGRRTVRDIRDAVSAACGPVPLDFVGEYLEALESIGVLEAVAAPPR